MIKNYPNSVPTIIGEVIERVRVDTLNALTEVDDTITNINYLYGNIKEVGEQLKKIVASPNERNTRFPLFILFEDIEIDRDKARANGYYGITDDMRIAICAKSSPQLTSAQREAQNFPNILRPLYHSFIDNLQKHRSIMVNSEWDISHRYIERKRWGTDDSTREVLGEYVDAIDMTRLRLKIDWKYFNLSINSTIQ